MNNYPIYNKSIKKSLEDLSRLDFNSFDSKDLNLYKNKNYYNYFVEKGSLLISRKKVKLNVITDLNLGSNELEWSENECDVNIFQIKSKEPLLCLFNGLEVIKNWKKDLKSLFPNNNFIFLLNYQNDEAQIATFRFEVLRENQKSVIVQILNNLTDADIDDKIGLYIDSSLIKL